VDEDGDEEPGLLGRFGVDGAEWPVIGDVDALEGVDEVPGLLGRFGVDGAEWPVVGDVDALEDAGGTADCEGAEDVEV